MSPSYIWSAGDEITAARINTMGTSATPEVVTRALDTSYQNTSGKTMTVLVTLALGTGACDGANTGGRAYGRIGSSSPAAIDVGEVYLNCGTLEPAGAISSRAVLMMVVPDDYYYEVFDGSASDGSATITKWVEIIP